MSKVEIQKKIDEISDKIWKIVTDTDYDWRSVRAVSRLQNEREALKELLKCAE